MKKSSRVQLCVPTNRHPFIHFGDVHPFAIPQCDMMRVSVCILKGLKVWHPKGSNMESCWPCWLIAFQSLWHNRYIYIIYNIYIYYTIDTCVDIYSCCFISFEWCSSSFAHGLKWLASQISWINTNTWCLGGNPTNWMFTPNRPLDFCSSMIFPTKKQVVKAYCWWRCPTCHAGTP
jgi:hypothetical protein